MLGKRARPFLTAKAAETHNLLEFAVYLLEIYKPRFRSEDDIITAALLLSAGRAAMRFDDVMTANQMNMNADAQEELCNSFMHFSTCYMRAGGHSIPKFHLMIHLVQRVCVNGNPRFSTTYKDESLNGVLARIGATCHRRHWEFNVHRKYNFMLHCEVTLEMH